jgi:hypothetical protein
VLDALQFLELGFPERRCVMVAVAVPQFLELASGERPCEAVPRFLELAQPVGSSAVSLRDWEAACPAREPMVGLAFPARALAWVPFPCQILADP